MEVPSTRVRAERVGGARGRLVATQDARRRRQVSHDLRHGLATVAVLAAAIGRGSGLDRDTSERVRCLESEVRRLGMLLEEELTQAAADVRAPETLVRIDVAAREMLDVLRETTSTRLNCVTTPTQSVVSPTAFWRALSNLVDNAIRAASPRGAVEVRVFSERGLAVIEVDDSGPGFGLASGGVASLGLGIVQDFVSRHDGSLELAAGSLGGCCVRLSLPAVPVLDLVEFNSVEDDV